MELAYPTALCLGLALALPEQRVYAVEGDGSLIAGMATLTTVARCVPPNLVVLVINNRSFASTGAQPTARGRRGRPGRDRPWVRHRRGGPGEGCRRGGGRAEPGGHGTRSALRRRRRRARGRTAGRSQAYPFDIVEAAVVFRRALEDRGLVPPSGRLKCSVHALSDDSALPKNPRILGSNCIVLCVNLRGRTSRTNRWNGDPREQATHWPCSTARGPGRRRRRPGGHFADGVRLP
ncbi:thiamine pyrophosphate-dependent enzyme [Streptomyces sp. NPDC093064]|uniref:thiamine pyrophosphate-dependent enzyme n=1 Tax=Streptomyces sp. NPDC093064 TaxID=3366020 RepID=UPI0037F8B6F0